jgi:hypothetical protein
LVLDAASIIEEVLLARGNNLLMGAAS